MFAEALDGIDGYSHLFVLLYFDRLRPEQIGPLKVKPHGLLKRGLELEELPLARCVRAQLADPPQSHRLDSRAFFTARGGNRLFVVEGLDFFDGTPILDIKGLQSQYRTDEFTVPEWFRALADEKGYV